MPLDVVNPFDQTVVCRVDYDEGAGLEAKVARADDACRRWRPGPLDRAVAPVQARPGRARAPPAETHRSMSSRRMSPLVARRWPTMFTLASATTRLTSDKTPGTLR